MVRMRSSGKQRWSRDQQEIRKRCYIGIRKKSRATGRKRMGEALSRGGAGQAGVQPGHQLPALQELERRAAGGAEKLTTWGSLGGPHRPQ